ncbi:phage holin family protein [Halomonas sp. HK25]|uniref:phage holin family protein n=1 Tax=Halomonas sp. HK25 TaxID=3394321 RepID=UPI0039FC987D
MNVPALLAVIAAVVIIIRIITFRRRGRRYRPGIAVVAWLLVAINTWLAVRILFTGHLDAWWIALLLAVIAASLLRAGGNLAHLLRPPWRY